MAGLAPLRFRRAGVGRLRRVGRAFLIAQGDAEAGDGFPHLEAVSHVAQRMPVGREEVGAIAHIVSLAARLAPCHRGTNWCFAARVKRSGSFGMTTQPAHAADAGLARGVAADGLKSAHLSEAGLAAAMAARAAAAADAAGSSIAGIVVLCVSLFENAAIMMRASRFIVSISIAGNSDTPPLVRPAFDETAVRGDGTRGDGGAGDFSGLLLPCLDRFQYLQRLIRRAAKRHCVAAVAENLGIREIGGHRQTQIVHSRYAEADNPADKV